MGHRGTTIRRFLFDTSLFISYLRGDGTSSVDAFAKAAQVGRGYLSVITFMELWLPRHRVEGGRRHRASSDHVRIGAPPQPTDREIQRQIEAVEHICKTYCIGVLYCTPNICQIAQVVLRHCHVSLGITALQDSLIIATGIHKCAHLVTYDGHWGEVVRRLHDRGELSSTIQVITPEEFIQYF